MNGRSALIGRRVRGIRIIDLAGSACLAVIVLIVYASKAGGGVEAAKIADTTRLIGVEEQEIRLLQAEDTTLTQPRRLRDLSKAYLHMGPVPADHDTTVELMQRRSAEAAALAAARPAPSSVPAPSPARAAPPEALR